MKELQEKKMKLELQLRLTDSTDPYCTLLREQIGDTLIEIEIEKLKSKKITKKIKKK
mgnify:CR=1 FL=1|jgi:hypothetical protein